MKIELREWSMDDKESMANICNSVERDYLSNRLPCPYTIEDAKWWLNMASKQEGKEGVFRSIMADGEIVGNISVEKKSDVYEKDGEIGYFLATESWSKGIMTRSEERRVGKECRL